MTLLTIVTCAVQLAEPLPPFPFAVTDMLSIVPPTAFDGTVTLSVAVLFSPAGIASDVGETVGFQPALSLVAKLKLSEAFSVLFTVTVYVNTAPFDPLRELGEIETSTCWVEVETVND